MSDTRTFRVVDEDGDYYEITGDPMDALNSAYRERAHLVALLAAQHPSHIGHNDPDAPDWAVVTIELPTGQACWHIAPDDMDLVTHVTPSPRFARRWDGHTTDEKYARIRHLTAKTHATNRRAAENAAALKPMLAAARRLTDAAAKRAELQREGAAEEVRTFLDTLPPRIDIVADWTRNGVRNELTAEALRAVLAERTALAARVAELKGEREAAAGFVAVWHDTANVQHEVDEIRCQSCRACAAGPLKSTTTLADLVVLAGRHECLPRMDINPTEES